VKQAREVMLCATNRTEPMTHPIITLPRMTLLAGLALVLALYSLAWNGTLHFDDEPNLNGLYSVEDLTSALRFTAQGAAGPTGRPIARATFAMQAEGWPEPRSFLIFNSVLHIVNGLLCFLLLARLLRWFLPEPRQAEWLAAAVALLWTASPFLASASLIVVQRMTGLSALFVLLFLWWYIDARENYRPERLGSNIKLAVIAGAGTLLAGLAKENGFLLPIFLLLIERLLVPAARGGPAPLDRRFLGLVLVMPTIAILAYLGYRGLTATGYELRDYSGLERLLTQPRAIVDYLRHLLIPLPTGMTPFHDDWQASHGLLSPITTLFSLLGLVALLAAAWLLRRTWPVFTFGIAFFFAGHLVESTTVPLELYFPHRNYVPALGLYLAIAYPLFVIALRQASWRRMAGGALAVYFALFCTVLALGTSLWGEHELSAEMWFKQKPTSLRAGQFLHRFYADNYPPQIADRFNELLIQGHPNDPMPALQALAVCNEDPYRYRSKLERAIRIVEQTRVISVNMSALIQQFSSIASTSDCHHLRPRDIQSLIRAANGNTKAFVHANAQVQLLFAEAQLANQKNEYRHAAKLLERSLAVNPTLDAALLIAYFHVQNDDRESAMQHVKRMISDPPVGFPESLAWKSRLGELLETLRPLENAPQSE